MSDRVNWLKKTGSHPLKVVIRDSTLDTTSFKAILDVRRINRNCKNRQFYWGVLLWQGEDLNLLHILSYTHTHIHVRVRMYACTHTHTHIASPLDWILLTSGCTEFFFCDSCLDRSRLQIIRWHPIGLWVSLKAFPVPSTKVQKSN